MKNRLIVDIYWCALSATWCCKTFTMIHAQSIVVQKIFVRAEGDAPASPAPPWIRHWTCTKLLCEKWKTMFSGCFARQVGTYAIHRVNVKIKSNKIHKIHTPLVLLVRCLLFIIFYYIEFDGQPSMRTASTFLTTFCLTVTLSFVL